mmetsp:Transcript_11686/g.27380  ORF Transcript_11686/g.27380 Transcript_11686/m.27380 type:complete len:172 (-) Transcript_11686:200-715(-)
MVQSWTRCQYRFVFDQGIRRNVHGQAEKAGSELQDNPTVDPCSDFFNISIGNRFSYCTLAGVRGQINVHYVPGGGSPAEFLFDVSDHGSKYCRNRIVHVFPPGISLDRKIHNRGRQHLEKYQTFSMKWEINPLEVFMHATLESFTQVLNSTKQKPTCDLGMAFPLSPWHAP